MSSSGFEAAGTTTHPSVAFFQWMILAWVGVALLLVTAVVQLDCSGAASCRPDVGRARSVAMDRKMEAAEIAAVETRLAERFPELDVEVVEAAVRLAHSQLTGDIRDFVPVLVEHTARDRLAAVVKGEAVER